MQYVVQCKLVFTKRKSIKMISEVMHLWICLKKYLFTFSLGTPLIIHMPKLINRPLNYSVLGFASRHSEKQISALHYVIFLFSGVPAFQFFSFFLLENTLLQTIYRSIDSYWSYLCIILVLFTSSVSPANIAFIKWHL